MRLTALHNICTDKGADDGGGIGMGQVVTAAITIGRNETHAFTVRLPLLFLGTMMHVFLAGHGLLITMLETSKGEKHCVSHDSVVKKPPSYSPLA